MSLQLPEGSRFQRNSGTDPIPQPMVSEFEELIGKIVAQGNRWTLLEHFKSYFCGAVGAAHHRSSGVGWAQTDLAFYMGEAAKSPELFVEAFYDACEALRGDGNFELQVNGRFASARKSSGFIGASSVFIGISRPCFGLPVWRLPANEFGSQC